MVKCAEITRNKSLNHESRKLKNGNHESRGGVDHESRKINHPNHESRKIRKANHESREIPIRGLVSHSIRYVSILKVIFMELKGQQNSP